MYRFARTASLAVPLQVMLDPLVVPSTRVNRMSVLFIGVAMSIQFV